VANAPRWLSDDEQAVWQAYRRMARRLDAHLARDLLRDSGLSMQDYDVLSNLSAAPDGRAAARQLGDQLLWSPSRLSHHVDRMENRGLVRREPRADGRGTDVVLTDAGWDSLRAAAPAHVESVRAAFFDHLSPRDQQALRRIGEAVVDGLETES
jgi:DNA-binding MarR family transcriptional regulator